MPANTNDCVFYSAVKKTRGFSLTAAYPKLIPTHPKSFNVLSLFSFYFTILNIQTRGFQLYCSPQPDSDWQVFAEPHWIVRHETYGSPTLLSCPPSHESFVAEVQVAGAVRSLSDQQEEASTLSHAHTFPLSYSTNRQTHSLSTPLWVCQLSLTSQTSSVQGNFPFVPSHSQVTFTRGCMLGMPRLCAGNIGPDNLNRQRQENESEREAISVCMFIKHCIYIIGIYVCAHLFYFISIV